MDLLKNAVASIQLGVADYEIGSQSRLLSAVRSIHAGVLLLYKEALRRLSPAGSEEAFVKAKVIPRRDKKGEIQFVGSGRKTVDAIQIRERFEGLGITTDWKRFQAITEIRNDVEHYYANVTKKALQTVVADAFVIVRTFVATELKVDPKELLGEQTWQTMLNVSEVYDAERRECDRLLDSVEWHSATLESSIRELVCQQCGSDLLRPEGTDAKIYDQVTLRCRACGSEECFESFIPRAIQSGLAFDSYLVGDDGADLPYVNCPECRAEAYVIEEQRCAVCGHEAEHTCARCGSTIPPEELDMSPYCGWCEHMMNKDD